MKKTFSLWDERKIIDLFNFVDKKQKEYLPLTKIFSLYAKKENKMPNSVRNYYYNQLEYFYKNTEIATKLNIDLNNFEKQKIVHFSKEEEAGIYQSITDLMKKGYSVRKACMTLSKGDLSLMMRYQNKYRANLSKQNNKSLDKQKNNILQFKNKKQTLTDQDINNLFLGLVKVIKRKSIEQVQQSLVRDCEWANNTLRKTLVHLNSKEQEVKVLYLKNTVLSQKLFDLQAEIARLCNKKQEVEK